MKKSTIVKGTLGIAAVTTAVSYVTFNEVMNRNAVIYPKVDQLLGKKYMPEHVPAEDPRRVWFKEAEKIQYEMINDKTYRLKGWLIPAEKPSKVYVFCAHGYRSCGFGEFGLMAKFYHDLGYNVFMVDHQAAGESDGKYIGFGVHESKDGLLWLRWMNEKFGKDIQIILAGVSMGCATVMLMTGSHLLPDNVKFTVADCGFTTAIAEFKHAMKDMMHVPGFPVINIANMFNKALSGYDFKEADCVKAVSNATIPMLFIHGANDDFVPTHMVHELYEACNSPYKDVLLVPGAGHAESYPKGTEAYEAKVKEFAEKFITE